MKARKTFSIKLAKLLKKIGDSLHKMFGGELPVFLLFLVITFFFWFAQKMGRNYEYSIQVPVRVIDVPENVRFTDTDSHSVAVTLSGKGFALWKSSRGQVKPLEISSSAYKMSNGRAVMPSHYVRDSIVSIMASGVVIRSIDPDTLSFFYEKQQLKKLPVAFNGTTESRSQYIMDSYHFTPDSVEAYVTESAVAVESLYADLDYIEIDADIVTVQTKLKQEQGVYTSDSQVTLTIRSSQYTEKSLSIPVSGVNFPEGKMVKSFPSRVTVVFWVKMSEYDNVTESDFSVVVDYNDITEGVTDKVELRIYSQPLGVERVRIIPQTVEYLIEDIYAIW